VYVSKYIKAGFKVDWSTMHFKAQKHEHFKAQKHEDHGAAQVFLMGSP
jgi:hypothetical protein